MDGVSPPRQASGYPRRTIMAKYCLDPDGAARVAHAILERAAFDYITALQGKEPSYESDSVPPEVMRKECEMFFRSQEFAMLCDLDPEGMIKACRMKARQEIEKERKRAAKRQKQEREQLLA